MTQSRAPLIIAIVLLLLPVLYVGSYLALVVPRGYWVPWKENPTAASLHHYRFATDTKAHNFAQRFYSPLERIDRKLRNWEPPPSDGPDGILLGGSS